jgi:hypothetical protein
LIRDDLIADIQAANPTVDVVKGPVYDLLLRPLPPVLGDVSDSVSALTNLYSPIVSGDGSNDAVINTLGQAFRVPKPVGSKATGTVTFYFTATPSAQIIIPAGTAVSTTDRSAIYVTVTGVVVAPTTAYRYYNAATARYEIQVDVVASIIGSGQSVPAQRLITMLSKVEGVSGVFNAAATTDGRDAGDVESYLALIQKRFLGMDSASFARHSERIDAEYPGTVTNYVLSTDYDSFRRPLRGDGFDCVVLEPVPKTFTDTFSVSVNGKYSVTGTMFLLSKQPVIDGSITGVYVNGSVLDASAYEVLIDIEPETRNSTRATTSVRVLSEIVKLKNTDTVTISYSFCSVCDGIQTTVFGTSTGTDFFGCDALVRLAESAGVAVSVIVRSGTGTGTGSDSLAGVGAASVSAIASAIQGFFNQAAFETTLVPEQLIAYLNATFTNLRQLQVTRFRRIDSYTAEVEPIALRRYEVPVALSGNVIVTQA